jgi:hypothetical protein
MSVQLKRFVYDFSGDDLVHKKVNEEVRFPFVIDMNKYVSGGFDEFLSGRIDRLKRSRADPSASATNDIGISTEAGSDHNDNAAPAVVEDPFAGMPDLVDYNGERCAEQLRELIDEKVNQMLLDDEKKAAAAETPAPRSEEEEFMDKCYDPEYAFSAGELDQLIASRGEWIYELFGVLIHSGAITGWDF